MDEKNACIAHSNAGTAQGTGTAHRACITTVTKARQSGA
ncbi:hypothetical protein P353_26650 [Comamonas testosteroni]|uniref:Uncharacterized protein n=1 Tax=Comamonas testosteroni TaxID=285 RepID=A0A096F1R1_COMTE|nr:hypothetical protein P353_26650 [Comamonas testosteroni]